MPAVFVTGPTATQNSELTVCFPALVLVSPTRGGMARLSGPKRPGNTGMVEPSKVVTNFCTGRARRSSTC